MARTVTAGDRLGDLWVIEKGLEAGDRVIVEGLQRMQPGVRVKYRVEPEPNWSWQRALRHGSWGEVRRIDVTVEK